MTRWYLDTSAAAKLLVVEQESAALIATVNRQRPQLVASLLLEIELRRMVNRVPELTQQLITDLLDRVSLHSIGAAQFTHAGLLPGTNLRSLDALHLAMSIDLQVDALLTYDLRLRKAAIDSGITVLSPGSP